MPTSFDTSFTTRPEITGSFGVVATTHWIATAVGMGILDRGGNAFDAGIAVAFVLQVVEPHLNGPGGDVPILIYDVKKKKPEVICGQGPAPAAATIARFQEMGLDMIPGSGLLATCIPGSFDAYMLLLRDYGTMSVEDVLAPAISYARNGYPLVSRICETIATVENLFREHWHTSAALYLSNGVIPKAGEIFRNEKLADTYARVLSEAKSAGGNREAQIERARKTWSQGFIAESINAFCRNNEVMDSSGTPHRGLLTGQDMAGWSAFVEAPISYDYRDYTVYKAGPWTQGLVLLQQLALLKGYDLDKLDPCSAEFIHLQVECAKLAFADRDVFYGDPKFGEIPVAQLLSDSYNAERRKLITDKASMELLPGTIPGFGKAIGMREGSSREAVSAFGTGEPTVGKISAERGDTVHFDIIDRDGNMISVTPSGGWLQSSPVIPELGFCLGTRAQMFWLDEEHPASLQPGKRPRSTLSPTFAMRDGKPYLAWGTPGGDQQDQWATQFLLRHIHAGYNLQQAIDAPAWHTEHFPASFWPRLARPGVLVLEGRVAPEVVKDLRGRGHIVEVGDDWSEGRLTAASRHEGWLRAAANPRGMQAYAAGR